MRTGFFSAVLAMVFAAPIGRAQAPVEVLVTPAGAGSGMYSLATGANGETYLAWLVPTGNGGHALQFSRFGGRGWDAPIEIASGTNWFVNWADHPSLTAARDGRLFVHLLVNTGRKAGAYGYAIRVQSSADAGRSWQTIFEEGLRNVRDYSGFLTFLPAQGGMSAVYLTPLAPDDEEGGHDAHGKGHVKAVGVVRFDGTGRELDRSIVDPDSCSCCSTDIAETSVGPVIVYRDHEAGEIRDISIVRRVDGRWTAPAPVHRDGWTINGCPTNGPAIAAEGQKLAVAWFTAAQEQPRVNVAFSTDAGATFSAPLRVDDGDPVGWPDVVILPNGNTVVSWLERGENGKGTIRVRNVSRAGRGTSLRVATAAAGRGTGIPMMAPARDGSLLVAWRDEQVRTARVTLPRDSSARR